MSGWIATGLRWRDGAPHLAATNGRREHERLLTPGTPVAWLLAGPRRCTGMWSTAQRRRRHCPHRSELDPGSSAVQCGPCQSVDPGLALARDHVLDNGQTYLLYLAWFGPGLLKVGITAEQRGTRRLLEQAAPVFTVAARGPLPAVRRAELTIAQSGLARERLTTRTKTDQWWSLGDADARRETIEQARTAALRLLDGHDVEQFPGGPVTDQVELFGLRDGAPAAYQEIIGLAAGAALAGALRAPIGRYLFLDPAEGGRPLLLDARLLTGWTLTATDRSHCAGLELRPRRRPHEHDAPALF
ncbi:DUF2797 domain-containing protein [Kitasatospora sp. NPDC050543]|uniref:DUF2797 domain-containing protein n=1 Tax=Kitasatospora sp. NPDC050543 TaxID=3364054 RepID=UPI00379B1F1D